MTFATSQHLVIYLIKCLCNTISQWVIAPACRALEAEAQQVVEIIAPGPQGVSELVSFTSHCFLEQLPVPQMCAARGPCCFPVLLPGLDSQAVLHAALPRMYVCSADLCQGVGPGQAPSLCRPRQGSHPELEGSASGA